MSFYKTNCPVAIKAWDDYNAAAADLRARCESFAAGFGGKAALYGNPLRFGGILFDSSPGGDLWCAADRDAVHKPRRIPRRGSTPEVRAAVKENISKWDAGRPDDRVCFDPIYKALGKNNSMDFIFTGMKLVRHGGWIYADTGADMPLMTEILGSEFAEANKAVQS